MSSNDRFNQDGNPFSSLLGSALSLVPFAVGLGVGVRNIASNDPVSIVGPGPNRIQNAGIAAGKKLKQSTTARDTTRVAATEKFKKALHEQLSKTDLLSKLGGKIEEHNAIIQSVLSTLEQPEIGLSENSRTELKTKIFSLINDSSADQKDLKAALVEAMTAVVDTGTNRGLDALRQNLGAFKSVGPQIKPMVQHTFSSRVPTPLTPMDPEFQKIFAPGTKAKRNFDYYKAQKFGKDFTVLKVAEQDGRFGIHAQWDFNGKTFTAPLDLDGTMKNGGPRTVYVGGDFKTRYQDFASYVDYAEVHNTLKRNPGAQLTHELLRSKMMDYEEFYKQKLASTLRDARVTSPAQISRKRFNQEVLEHVISQPRMAVGSLVASSDPERKFAQHLSRSSVFQHRTLKMVGAEKLRGLPGAVEQVMEQMSRARKDGKSVWDFGLGGDSLMHRNPDSGMVSTMVARAEESSLAAMRTGMPNTRINQPYTARDHQVVGRDAMFVEGKKRSLGASWETGEGARNIDWADSVTGGTNRAIILNVKKGNRIGLEGTGEAYSVSGATVRTAFTMPVLDPSVHEKMSSGLLNKLLGMTPGEHLQLTPAQIKEYQGYVGSGPDGTQKIKLDPNMSRLGIRIEEVAEETKDAKVIRRIFHLSGSQDTRLVDAAKFFGNLFKGNTQHWTSDQARAGFKKMGLSNKDKNAAPGFMERHGLDIDETLFTDGAMMKKSAANMSVQMVSGLGIVAKYDDPMAYIENAAKSVIYSSLDKRKITETLADGTVKQTVLSETNDLARSAGAVIKELADRKVGAEDAGRVLAGIWNMGEEFGNSEMRVSQGDLRTAFEEAFGIPKAKEVIRFADEGYAIGAATWTPGNPHSEYKHARGSMEPRFLPVLQARLRQMDFAEEDVSDFLARILARKPGVEHQLRVFEELKKVQDSILGNRSPVDELTQSAKRMTIDDLREVMTKPGGVKGEALQALLKDNDGIIIDLASGKGLQGQMIEAAAKKTFDGGTEVYFSGKKIMESLRVATIKQAGKSVDIHSEYVRSFEGLANSLVSMTSTNSIEAARSAGDTLQAFKKQMTTMTVETLDSTVRGKVAGSVFMNSASYDDNSMSLDDGQKLHIKETLKKTHGQAVWVNSEGFLGRLQDYMGTAEGGGKAGLKDAGEQLKMFYGSQEAGATSPNKGVVAIHSRHPQVSVGNIAPVQEFRDVRKVGLDGAEDVDWQRWTESSQGRKALGRLQSQTKQKITSFSDVARLSGKNSDHASRFFRSMAANISSFIGTEGGGQAFYAQYNVGVTLKNGDKVNVPFSISAGASGDQDGDHMSSFSLDEKSRKGVLDSLKGDRGAKTIGANARYKTYSHLIKEDMKKAAKRAGSTITDDERVYQDALKELAAKDVGPLSTKLSMVRSSLVAFSQQDDTFGDSMAWLKNLEEHAALGSKHHATFEGLPQRITDAVTTLFDKKDVGPLRALAMEMHKGGDLFTPGGLGINSVDADVDGRVASGLAGTVSHGDSIIDRIHQVAMAAVESGDLQKHATSDREIRLMMGISSHEAWDIMSVRGATNAGSVALGFSGGDAVQATKAAAGDTMQRVLGAVGKLDHHMLGPMAVGVLGSLMLGGAMGDEGYGAEPLLMEGEEVAPRVSSAMSSQSLFSSNQVGPTPDQLQQSGGFPTVQNPINTPQTYMGGQNPYQVRGEIYGGGGVNQAMSRMNGLAGQGGYGSVTVNDRRRPITANYIDRLLGED